MTGAPIPSGADSVVPFEDAKEENGFVKVFGEAVKHKNCRFAGESLKAGDKALLRGDRLSSADLGILASLNHSSVKVYKQPTVAIISTGDEIADVGQDMKPDQIRDANACVLCAEVRKYGAVPQYLGIAQDTLKDIKEIYLKALKSDVVISTGGVSMGHYDFVKKNYSDLKVDIRFERVNVRPGTPFTFGTKGRKLYFGLPGRPISTLNSFIQFVRPALLKLIGATKLDKPVVAATLEEDIVRAAGHGSFHTGAFHHPEQPLLRVRRREPEIVRRSVAERGQLPDRHPGRSLPDRDRRKRDDPTDPS